MILFIFLIFWVKSTLANQRRIASRLLPTQIQSHYWKAYIPPKRLKEKPWEWSSPVFKSTFRIKSWQMSSMLSPRITWLTYLRRKEYLLIEFLKLCKTVLSYIETWTAQTNYVRIFEGQNKVRWIVIYTTRHGYRHSKHLKAKTVLCEYDNVYLVIISFNPYRFFLVLNYCVVCLVSIRIYLLW